MLPRVFILACTFGLLTGFGTQEGFNPNYRGARLMPILLALDGAHVSGYLELSGSPDAQQVPNFPEFSAPTTYANPVIRTLREILAVAPTIQVTEVRGGLVRMIDRGVPADILNIRIAHVELRGHYDGQVHNPDEALACILKAPEVATFMKAHDIDYPDRGGGVPGNLFGHWPPEAPHMSGSLDNVTLSEALDRVLETFPGLWVYENYAPSANRKRDVYLGFFYLEKEGRRVVVVE